MGGMRIVGLNITLASVMIFGSSAAYPVSLGLWSSGTHGLDMTDLLVFTKIYQDLFSDKILLPLLENL